MLFNSLHFLIFFPIVVLIYFVVPKRVKYLWLLISSYYFYMSWNARYALLLLFSTAITYLSGLLLDRVKRTAWEDKKKVRYKKLIVFASVSLSLLLLFCFKYANFAGGLTNRVLAVLHTGVKVPRFDIVLPVGISFYTFQALGYMIDVYREEIYAEKNFFRYALFVSFFPQLVAGPIERSKNLLKQLSTPVGFSYDRAKDGVYLMLWGYFLKIVIADRIALFVDTVYGDYMKFGGWYLIVATVLFAFQIYCDFCGYSTIAMGAARVLGISLMENFDVPYLSVSVSDFWRRWHISLTSWFRDYLYIPLGGNRKGKLRKYVNKMIVFMVSGLWHGSSLAYVLWGGMNGLYQVIGEITKPLRDRMVSLLHLHRDSLGHKIFCRIQTFLLVDLTWLFFRTGHFLQSFRVLRQMVTVRNPWILFDGSLYNCGLNRANFGLLLICLGVLFFADYCKKKGIVIRNVIARQDYWFRLLFFVFSVCAILTFGIWGPGYDEANFIYFQF